MQKTDSGAEQSDDRSPAWPCLSVEGCVFVGREPAVGFVWAGLSHMGALKTAAGVAGESGAHAGAARGKQRCRRQCSGNPAFSADEGLHRWNQRDRATPGRVSA